MVIIKQAIFIKLGGSILGADLLLKWGIIARRFTNKNSSLRVNTGSGGVTCCPGVTVTKGFLRESS